MLTKEDFFERVEAYARAIYAPDIDLGYSGEIAAETKAALENLIEPLLLTQQKLEHDVNGLMEAMGDIEIAYTNSELPKHQYLSYDTDPKYKEYKKRLNYIVYYLGHIPAGKVKNAISEN